MSDRPELLEGDASTELSANRTAMSFERTGMSMDRTLMSVVRTSLSLIGFGFTIFQFFHSLNTKFLDGALPAAAPSRFGLMLISLGVILLVLGIFDHVRSARQLRKRRQRLFDLGIIHHVAPTKISSSLAVAIALLAAGLLAIVRITLRIGPF